MDAQQANKARHCGAGLCSPVCAAGQPASGHVFFFFFFFFFFAGRNWKRARKNVIYVGWHTVNMEFLCVWIDTVAGSVDSVYLDGSFCFPEVAEVSHEPYIRPAPCRAQSEALDYTTANALSLARERHHSPTPPIRGKTLAAS